MAHNALHHRFDVFELSADCFCTVLEFCEGSDLDLVRFGIYPLTLLYCVTRLQVLKTNKFLPEREARSIIVQVLLYVSSSFWQVMVIFHVLQVVSALRYLNMQVTLSICHHYGPHC